jgi:serine/threonine protein kinase/tetratricopeptide (TPR) repeat protein
MGVSPKRHGHVRLGDYVLIEQLGRGAMGEVWRGMHVKEGFQVAVKLATGMEDRPDALNSFFREVQTAGRLRHPYIAHLYDQGTVSAEEAKTCSFAEGSPYIVLEFVGGTRLSKLCGRISFSEVKTILLQVLDAIAYAHGTGVIHRDIKPSNIVRSADGLSIKLVDFGVSLYGATWDDIADNWTLGKSVSGTPTYMAPEQVRGEHRSIGPQSDLYAVGCLAFTLVAGRPPFGKGAGQSSEDVMRLQLHAPIPPLPEGTDAPPEFQSWMRKLLEKDAGLRAQRAATVRHALTLIEPTTKRDEQGLTPPVAVEVEVETLASSEPVSTGRTPRQPLEGVSTLANLLAPGGFVFDAPPFVNDWRTVEHREVFLPKGAYGANVFGVRRMPIVGREREQDIIWDAARDVMDRGRMRVVILEGDDGLGKAALADWAAERTNEIGSTHYSLISHRAPGSSDGGVTGMLSRLLRATHMSPRELSRHLAELVKVGRITSTSDAEDLYRLLAPGHAWRQERATAFEASVSTEERYALATRILRARFDTRPLILCVENVHFGLDALGYIRFLIDTELERDLPLLVIATVRASGLEQESPVWKFLNEQVALHPRCTWVKVERLGLEDTKRFVDELLPLEPGLRETIASHSGGSPSFARHLIQGLVDRRALTASGSTYALADATELKLPVDTRALWDARATEALDGTGEQDAIATEIAAVLGHQVDVGEWSTVCSLAEVEPSPRLLHKLAEKGVIRLKEDVENKHFSFLGGALRDAILRRAYGAGRTTSHHQHAAALLSRVAGPRGRERLGRHLVGADHLAAAIGPLTEAATARKTSADYWEAGALMNQVLGLMDDLDLPRTDHRWANALLMAAELALERFDYAIAENRAKEAIAWADENREPVIRAKALRIHGLLDLHASRFTEGIEKLRWAAERFEEVSDMDTALETRAWVVYALDAVGERSEGAELAKECIRVSRLLGHDEQLCRHTTLLALIALKQNRLSVASLALEEAIDVADRLGKARWQAVIHNTSGEIARSRGHYEKADRLYGEAARLWSLTGLGRQRWAVLNQALARCAMREFDSARERVEWVLRATQSSGDSFLNCIVHAALAWVSAGQGRFDEMDAALERVNADTATGEWNDMDVAQCLEGAGLEAMRQGHAEQSEVILARALDMWRALEREEETLRVSALLMETADDTV